MSQKKDRSVFKIYLIYFISMVLFSVVRILSGLGFLSNINNQLHSVIFTILIQVVIMTIIPAILYLTLYKGEKVKDMLAVSSVKKISFKVVLISFAIGVLVFFVNIIVSTIFSLILTILGYSQAGGGSSGQFASAGGWMFLLELILVAVLPAIGEEFLHRGILLGKTTKIGYKKSIIISSLLFGLIHFNINQFSYAFVLGIIIAFVVIISKSIWPAIIIHFSNNAISLYLSYARQNKWFGHNFYEILDKFLQSNNAILSILTTTLFVFIVLGGLMYFIIKMFKETTIKNVNKSLEQVMSEGFIESEKGFKLSEHDKKQISTDILVNQSNLNLSITPKTNPIDVMLPINRNVFKPKLFDNTFLISTIVLGSLATIFTLVWGLVW